MTASSHPAAPRPPPARGDERGAGLISSIGGVLMFFVFLTVATHLLVGLHARSVVTSAAYDAARSAASSGDPANPRVQATAEATARELLGGVGESARFDWTVDVGGGVVRLRVLADSPSLLLPVVSDGLGVEKVDRTVTIRIERPVG